LISTIKLMLMLFSGPDPYIPRLIECPQKGLAGCGKGILLWE
jgi:hypothetical protein